MERKDRAQKAVVEALHNCSAAEKVARIYMYVFFHMEIRLS